MDVNLAALQKYDPKVTKILRSALQVAIYGFNSAKSVWEKTYAEGTMFMCSRSDCPYYAMMLLNKLNTDNFLESITPDMEVAQENPQYLLYRKGDKYIRSIWFFNKQECSDFASTLTKIIEKLDDQKKLASFENGDLGANKQQTQVSSRLNQPTTTNCDNDIASLLNKAQLRNREESTGVKPSVPVLFKPVPIQLDSLMQSSTPVNADVVAAATTASGGGRRQNQPQQQHNVGGAARPPLSSEVGDASSAAAGNDLLQKLLTGSASVSSPSRQSTMQPLKSLPPTTDQSALEFLRTPESRVVPPRAKDQNLGTGYSSGTEMRSSASRTLNGSHFLLTPADFEATTGDAVVAQSQLTGAVDSKYLAPQESHSSVLEKAALKRALIDLLQNDDDVVEIFYKKLSLRSNRNH